MALKVLNTLLVQRNYCCILRNSLKGLFHPSGCVCLTDQTRGNFTTVADQERGRRGERGQGLILSFGKSVRHEKCHIFDAD